MYVCYAAHQKTVTNYLKSKQSLYFARAWWPIVLAYHYFLADRLFEFLGIIFNLFESRIAIATI